MHQCLTSKVLMDDYCQGKTRVDHFKIAESFIMEARGKSNVLEEFARVSGVYVAT